MKQKARRIPQDGDDLAYLSENLDSRERMEIGRGEKTSDSFNLEDLQDEKPEYLSENLDEDEIERMQRGETE